MEYRREIDGLRALAVLPVVLFHAGVGGFSGGFVGVDIFFVISGYLITSLILAELDTGRFSLRHFYERRARRILPALYTVMLVCLALAWLLLLPADLDNFAQSMMAVAGFGSNLLFWQTQGYFGPAAELQPLLHTWSLAVEEQFYLLFPLLLMLGWRRGRRRTACVLALLALASLALAQWASLYAPVAAFYLLPMRGWELLAGALAACYLHGAGARAVPAWLAESGSLLGAALIVTAIAVFDSQTPFPGLYALVPTAGAVAIIVLATPSTLTGRWLGARVPVGVGLISYSTYLWHQPLLAFAKLRYVDALDAPMTALLVMASLALGLVTWKFVEAPFRQRERVPARQILHGSVAGAAVFLALGALLHGQNGYGGYYYATLSAQQKQRLDLIAAHTANDMLQTMVDDGACRFWGRTVTPALAARFEDCAARFGKAVIIFGDSHAMNFYNVMAKAGVHPFVVGISQGYCRFDTNKPYCALATLDRFLRQHAAQIQTAAYHQTGNPLLLDAQGNALGPHKFDGQSALTVDHAQIDAIVRALDRPDVPLRFVWVGPWAEAQVPAAALLLRQPRMNQASVAAFRQLDQAIAGAVVGSGTRVAYVSSLDAFASTGQSLWDGDCLLFRDLNHLSGCGEDRVARAGQRRFWDAVIGAAPAPGR